jgi:AraC-like DNA-binding protein
LEQNLKYQREITPLADQDSFLVINRIRDTFDYPIHFHPEMELNFIADGKGMKRTVGYSSEDIDDYELVLVGPNVYHGWEMHHCDHAVHEVTIQFHNDLFSPSLLRRSLMRPLKDLFDRSVNGILFDKKEAEKIAPRLFKVSEQDGIEYFFELFSILYDLSKTSGQRLLSAAERPSHDFENSDRIKMFYDYIQQNYHKKITLDEVAELLNMSKVSFNRFMKKTSRQTFIEYLNEVRTDNAARLLAAMDYSISEIAFKCGFNNIANFNRIFKKTKKLTPSAYRKKFYNFKQIQ